MARPEEPVDHAAPYAAFALHLRKQRAEGGSPTYSSLARRTGYSVSALSQAAAGRKLPSLDLTLAFAKACGGDGARWEKLWETARCQDTARGDGGLPPEPRVQLAEPPVPTSAETVHDFVMCLRELKAWAGNPSLSRIEKASQGTVRRSTLGDALNPARTSPPPWRSVVSLVLTLLELAHKQGRIENSEYGDMIVQWMERWIRLRPTLPAETGFIAAARPRERSTPIVHLRRPAKPVRAPEADISSLEIISLKTAIASHRARLAELEAQLRKAVTARELRLLDRRSA
ncbi:helix-turn-helix transcriptional regulator [Streptomyces sp. VNUA116]|uniref:helix-turn-helix domain-containing protein n=1 Tax=Streptomyces sp. VNUA116 TaxID=3062449 RepID=UPI002676D1F2|nr:helix-turn-helix transcriptional regulator [Streptomyces sp. VNUA116]WKU46475.1 helix-turn-helix transcriptional regulator [Streptomyces sp. VNUA116]